MADLATEILAWQMVYQRVSNLIWRDDKPPKEGGLSAKERREMVRLEALPDA